MQKKNTRVSKNIGSVNHKTLDKKKSFPLLFSPTLWVKVILVGQMVLLGLQFTPNISTNGDDAVYYILGKSLASGHGYRNIHLAGSPIATSYPIVFPAFLAITHFITNTPLLAKIFVACFGCLVTLASFYLFRRWAAWSSVPLVLIVGSIAVLNQHALELLSEIPYVALTLISLILLDLSYKAPNKKWLFWLAIVVSVLPMNCRSIGMAFSGAFIIANIWNKKFNYAIAHCVVLAGTIVCFKMLTSWNTPYLLQLFQVNSYDPEQGYASVSEMISRVMTNIGKYSSEILPESLFPSFSHANQTIIKPLGVGISFLIGLSCLRSFFQPFRIVGFYAIFYCGILSLWQSQWSSGRFLAGILPFLLFLFFCGISTVWEFVNKIKYSEKSLLRNVFINNPLSSLSKSYVVFLWVIAFLLMFDNIGFQIENTDQRKQFSRDWINFFSCADWIRQNTPQDALIVSRKTEHVYLRSLRQGILYPFSHDKNIVIAEIKKQHASYILVDGFFWTGTTQRYLYPALQSHPEMYRIVYALRNPDTYVLQIIDK
jgi:hypothetical protein